MPESLPTHYNFQHLAILKDSVPHLGLLWVRNILEACPLMQKLELHSSFWFLQTILIDVVEITARIALSLMILL